MYLSQFRHGHNNTPHTPPFIVTNPSFMPPHPAIAIIGVGVLDHQIGFMYASYGAPVRLYDTITRIPKCGGEVHQHGTPGLGSPRAEITYHCDDHLDAVV